MLLGMMVHSRLSMEGHEYQSEGIKGCDEYGRQNAEIRKTRTRNISEMDRLYDRILGEESRKPGNP